MRMTEILPPLIPRAPYLARKIAEHPLANKQGYVLEHRRVAWEIYGPFEVALTVHHIDGDTTNNLPENLELLTLSDHAQRHADENRKHDYAEIAAAYIAGATTIELEERFGVNRGNVSRIVRRMGVATRPRGATKGTSLTPEQRAARSHPQAAEMVEAYLNGESLEGVAERFGVFASTVQRHVRRAGHETRSTGRPRLSRFTASEIEAAVKDAKSWREVGRRLGVAKETARRLVEGHGMRLG